MEGWGVMDMKRGLKGLTWGVGKRRYEVLKPNATS